jgi:hypothetical protein
MLKKRKNNSNATEELAELLEAKQPLFRKTVADLEKISGKNNVVKSLKEEIDTKFNKFGKDVLNLDVDSTGGEDIYKALMFYIWKQNDLVLTKYLGLKTNASLDEVLSACIKLVNTMKLPRKVFRLKGKKAKELLIDNPPKEIMKLLGYTDVKEMLSKERLEEVYGALRFAEGEQWLENFNKQYKNLRPEDFQEGIIDIVKMPLKWAPLTEKFIEKKKHNITHLKELGVILVLETEDEEFRHGLVLKALPLIVHYFYEVHLYSAFFRLKAKTINKGDFGKLLMETIIADPKTDLKIAGEHIHWRVIQRYFGKLDDARKHPEIFEPHLQPEDLHWDMAEKALAKYIPELKVWEDLDYVAVEKDGLPLSLNLMDLTLSFANKNRYKEHLFYHFRESLWNEIFARYMSREVLEEELLAKLNNALVRPEKL